jgi:hypothetical protein
MQKLKLDMFPFVARCRFMIAEQYKGFIDLVVLMSRELRYMNGDSRYKQPEED